MICEVGGGGVIRELGFWVRERFIYMFLSVMFLFFGGFLKF